MILSAEWATRMINGGNTPGNAFFVVEDLDGFCCSGGKTVFVVTGN